MGLPARKTDRRYTYGDYRSWPEDERWELIDGVAWNMSPAPSVDHQRVLGRLYRQIAGFLEGQKDTPCEVFLAAVDVLLPASADQEMDEVDTVVQPDLLVVCDPARILPRGCWGAPDLAIEILSPWTSKKDLADKHGLYARHGVREYLILDPQGRWLHVYRLAPDRSYGDPEVYVLEPGRPVPRVPLEVLEGFDLDLARVFA